jgi:hypothetical protein
MLYHLADCLRGHPHEIPPVGRSGTIKYKVQRYAVSYHWFRTVKNIKYSGTENQLYGFVQVQLNIRYKGKVFIVLWRDTLRKKNANDIF